MEDEIKTRLENWKPLEPKVKKGYLAIYSQLAEPPEKGAGINTNKQNSPIL